MNPLTAANINLYTDAPKHNLALMKLSAWHKAQGHEVSLNLPIMPCDYSYASILFEKNKSMFNADEYGGPAYVDGQLSKRDGMCENKSFKEHLECNIENMRPDYDLFGLDYSLGYSFRPCFRKCGFCKVWKTNHPDNEHHSIYDFHNTKFTKICLLNNNTFFDKRWKETFEEIWDAKLTVIDENGYDLRLLDDEKADALHKTKWATPLHFAFDNIKDESKIRNGLALLEKHHLRSTSNGVYVLIGYDSTREEDIARCQIIDDYGLTPYPMPFVPTKDNQAFKRFINLHYYRNYPTIEKAWMDYAA